MDLESKLLLAKLLTTQQVAALGTVNDGNPEVSMVAYLPAQDFSKVYIHISALARHTKNILKHPAVGLMVSEVAAGDKDPQTLARLSLQGIAKLLDKKQEDYSQIKLSYLEKYPDAEVSFGLGDFNIYAIDLDGARFVAGFGRIFNVSNHGLSAAAEVYGQLARDT